MTNMMRSRLGRSELRISRLVLGTATFGGQCDEETSFRIMDKALELGINIFDTADKYPLGTTFEQAGTTESIVGRWLASRRPDVLIATKVHGRTGPNPWDEGLSRRHIRDAVHASLSRLQVDVIDLYQLHRPDPMTPIHETLAVLTELVEEGKVRFVGCSNFRAAQVVEALECSDARGYVRFTSVQPRYNLLFRQHERELLPVCEVEDLGVLTYNLLAGGLLSGKHRRGEEPDADSRFSSTGAAQLYRERYWHEEAFAAVEGIADVARSQQVPIAVLAAAWVLHQPVVTAAIVGATRPEHLDSPAAALDLALDEVVMGELDAISSAFREGDAVQ